MKQLLSLLAFIVLACAGTSAAQAQPSPVPSASPMAEPPMNPSTMSPAPAMSPGPAMKAGASPSPSPSPSPSASPPAKFIGFSGYGDVGYTTRVGNATTQFTNLFPSRVFDYGNGVTNGSAPAAGRLDLQNLNVQAALSAGNLAGKLELSAGDDANIIQSYPGTFNGFDVTQAYLAYTLGKLTVQGGKFETLAGAEVIESPSDLNFSRSILFGFAVPFTHTGGRLTYAVTPHVNVIGGVNAGWDEIRSTNGRLTAEYGFAFNPSSAVSLTAQGYTGIEQIANYYNGFNPYANGNAPYPNALTGDPSGATGNQTPIQNSLLPRIADTGIPPSAQGQRTLVDVVGTVHPTAATTLTFNYDRGLQRNAVLNSDLTTSTAGWSGLAGYASYQLNPRFVASVRYEGFHDPQGYRTGYQQFWREGTATVGYGLTSALTLRAEFRHDVSDQDVFLRPDGSFDHQNSTIGLEGIVKF